MDDLKVSLRQLLKTPGFTVSAIGVLALGIGLNAAMFSIIHALIFASRPFPEPDRLVQLYDRDDRTTGDYRPFSYPLYQELTARADVFEGVLAHTLTIVGIGEGVESRRTFSAVVSANYFDVLGVPLLQGRGFTIDESRPGADLAVVVTTYAYWKRTGFNRNLVGMTVRINGRPFTIVGIAPPGFTGTMSVVGPELFLPLGVFHSLSNDFQEQTSSRTLDRADAYNLFLVARMKDGVSTTAASHAMGLVGRGLREAFPAEFEHRVLSAAALPRFGTSTSPSDESVLTTLGMTMLGMTGAVLLTVCLNLASMLHARGRARRRELAIRLALGGGRGRIVRQLLVEAALLSIAGGGLGVALGSAGIDALLASIARVLPITIVLEGAVSPALIASTIFYCVLATIAFALVPALKHSRADIVSDLKAQTGDDPAPRRWRFVPRNPLVAAQVALSLSLLIAAGLFMRMAVTAASLDLGYAADDTVLAEVDGRLGGFDEAQNLDLYARLEARLASLPGVHSASIGALVPLGTISISKNVQRAGVLVPEGTTPATPESGRAFSAAWNAVGASYFDAMGVRILSGRRFTAAETLGKGAPVVAIVDDTLARKLWPDENALGQRIQWAPDAAGRRSDTPMEIIAVVSTTRRELFEREPRGAVFVPFAQGFMSNVFFHVRSTGPPARVIDAVRREIRAIAPGVPLFNVQTFRAHVDSSPEYWALTLWTMMFALFGALAMIVALVGIHAVTAYAVARRTREIGVRIAVGARPTAILRTILGDSLATVTLGVVIGLLLGLGTGRLLASIFVDLASFDVWTFALAPLGLIAAALAATWIPARRATAINPVTALRAE